MNQFVLNVFKQRLKAHRDRMWEFVKSVIDWVVWLYIIIPIIGIGGYHYYSWWTNPWDYQITPSTGLTFVYIGLFFFITNGNIRYFLERADQLFFRQHQWQYHSLMKRGALYSITIHFILTLFIFLALAPILLVQFQMSYPTFIALFFFIWLCRVLLTIGKQLLHIRWQGWKYNVIKTIAVLTLGFFYSGVLYTSYQYESSLLIVFSVFVMSVITAILFNHRIKKRGTFERDMVQEVMLKYRLTSLMLQQASFIGAPKFQRLKGGKSRKRPWLFRKSGTIFKKRNGKNGYLELHIKYILRNKQKWGLLLQFTSASVVALFVAPTVLKYVVWFLVIIIFNQFQRGFVNEINQSVFLKTFDWDEKKINDYSLNSMFWTNFPFMLFIGAWVGGILFPWWGIFLMAGLTISLSYVTQLFTVR